MTTVSLGELSDVITKGTTPTTLGYQFVNAGINFIKSESITFDGRIDRSKFAFIDTRTHETIRRSQLQEGDILFSMAGVFIGKTAVVPSSILPANTNQAVGIVRLKRDLVEPRFIDYFLRNPTYNRFVNNLIAQSAQPNLNLTEIRNLPITLPPLVVQKAIAKILGDLDDKIELNRRMNETLEAMARALFQSWFVDFDPVRAKMDGREPVGMDKETAALWPSEFEESELGLVPKGWEVKAADEVALVSIGKTPPRTEHHWFSENPEDVAWMSIRDLGNAGVYISHTTEFLTEEAIGRFNVKRIPDNTVVLSFKLTMGRVAITDGEMVSNEAIAHFSLRPETILGERYLYCYLKSFDYDRLGSTSSIATAINSDMVRKIPVLVPPKMVADMFERAIGSQFLQMKNIQKQSRSLATLRDTLLPKLLSGEIGVEAVSQI